METRAHLPMFWFLRRIHTATIRQGCIPTRLIPTVAVVPSPPPVAATATTVVRLGPTSAREVTRRRAGLGKTTKIGLCIGTAVPQVRWSANVTTTTVRRFIRLRPRTSIRAQATTTTTPNPSTLTTSTNTRTPITTSTLHSTPTPPQLFRPAHPRFTDAVRRPPTGRSRSPATVTTLTFSMDSYSRVTAKTGGTEKPLQAHGPPSLRGQPSVQGVSHPSTSTSTSFFMFVFFFVVI